MEITHSAFSRRGTSEDAQAFRKQSNSQIVCHVTGGLKSLYAGIKDGTAHRENAPKGFYTNSSGHFLPERNLMLGNRYCLQSCIEACGQSAILVIAKDHFHHLIPVVIKIMHTTYLAIGQKEVETLRRMKSADPRNISHTVKLLNSFMFGDHLCLVFPLLNSQPLTKIVARKILGEKQLISALRRISMRLLSALAFLKRQNTIHADVKPANILVEQDDDLDTVTLIDFGNAIHHTHREVTLYYSDFELQTLPYRAPEVHLGNPFSVEIDMWSLGCVLLELYLGETPFPGANRTQALTNMMSILGPLPPDMCKRGKCFSEVEALMSATDHGQNIESGALRLMSAIPAIRDYEFASFLAGLLTYHPDKRLTPWEALQHPFMAPEICIPHFLADMTPVTDIIRKSEYNFKQNISPSVQRLCPSTFDLLRVGTRDNLQAECSKIAVVNALNAVNTSGKVKDVQKSSNRQLDDFKLIMTGKREAVTPHHQLNNTQVLSRKSISPPTELNRKGNDHFNSERVTKPMLPDQTFDVVSRGVTRQISPACKQERESPQALEMCNRVQRRESHERDFVQHASSQAPNLDREPNALPVHGPSTRSQLPASSMVIYSSKHQTSKKSRSNSSHSFSLSELPTVASRQSENAEAFDVKDEPEIDVCTEDILNCSTSTYIVEKPSAAANFKKSVADARHKDIVTNKGVHVVKESMKDLLSKSHKGISHRREPGMLSSETFTYDQLAHSMLPDNSETKPASVNNLNPLRKHSSSSEQSLSMQSHEDDTLTGVSCKQHRKDKSRTRRAAPIKKNSNMNKICQLDTSMVHKSQQECKSSNSSFNHDKCKVKSTEGIEESIEDDDKPSLNMTQLFHDNHAIDSKHTVQRQGYGKGLHSAGVQGHSLAKTHSPAYLNKLELGKNQSSCGNSQILSSPPVCPSKSGNGLLLYNTCAEMKEVPSAPKEEGDKRQLGEEDEEVTSEVEQQEQIEREDEEEATSEVEQQEQIEQEDEEEATSEDERLEQVSAGDQESEDDVNFISAIENKDDIMYTVIAPEGTDNNDKSDIDSSEPECEDSSGLNITFTLEHPSMELKPQQDEIADNDEYKEMDGDHITADSSLVQSQDECDRLKISKHRSESAIVERKALADRSQSCNQSRHRDLLVKNKLREQQDPESEISVGCGTFKYKANMCSQKNYANACNKYLTSLSTEKEVKAKVPEVALLDTEVKENKITELENKSVEVQKFRELNSTKKPVIVPEDAYRLNTNLSDNKYARLKDCYTTEELKPKIPVTTKEDQMLAELGKNNASTNSENRETDHKYMNMKEPAHVKKPKVKKTRKEQCLHNGPLEDSTHENTLSGIDNVPRRRACSRQFVSYTKQRVSALYTDKFRYSYENKSSSPSDSIVKHKNENTQKFARKQTCPGRKHRKRKEESSSCLSSAPETNDGSARKHHSQKIGQFETSRQKSINPSQSVSDHDHAGGRKGQRKTTIANKFASHKQRDSMPERELVTAEEPLDEFSTTDQFSSPLTVVSCARVTPSHNKSIEWKNSFLSDTEPVISGKFQLSITGLNVHQPLPCSQPESYGRNRDTQQVSQKTLTNARQAAAKRLVRAKSVKRALSFQNVKTPESEGAQHDERVGFTTPNSVSVKKRLIYDLSVTKDSGNVADVYEFKGTPVKPHHTSKEAKQACNKKEIAKTSSKRGSTGSGKTQRKLLQSTTLPDHLFRVDICDLVEQKSKQMLMDVDSAPSQDRIKSTRDSHWSKNSVNRMNPCSVQSCPSKSKESCSVNNIWDSEDSVMYEGNQLTNGLNDKKIYHSTPRRTSKSEKRTCLRAVQRILDMDDIPASPVKNPPVNDSKQKMSTQICLAKCDSEQHLPQSNLSQAHYTDNMRNTDGSERKRLDTHFLTKDKEHSISTDEVLVSDENSNYTSDEKEHLVKTFTPLQQGPGQAISRKRKLIQDSGEQPVPHDWKMQTLNDIRQRSVSHDLSCLSSQRFVQMQSSLTKTKVTKSPAASRMGCRDTSDGKLILEETSVSTEMISQNKRTNESCIDEEIILLD